MTPGHRLPDAVYQVPNKYRPRRGGTWEARIDGRLYRVADVRRLIGIGRVAAILRFQNAGRGLMKPIDILNPKKQVGREQARPPRKANTVRARAEDLSPTWRLALCRAWVADERMRGTS